MQDRTARRTTELRRSPSLRGVAARPQAAFPASAHSHDLQLLHTVCLPETPRQ